MIVKDDGTMETGNQLYAPGSKYRSITSYTKANDFISEYMSMTRRVTKLIYSYIRFNDKGTFDNMSVQKNNIQFLFVRYVESAFGGEAIEPAENALVNTSRQVDQHYTYTIDNDVVPVHDDEMDDEDGM